MNKKRGYLAPTKIINLRPDQVQFLTELLIADLFYTSDETPEQTILVGEILKKLRGREGSIKLTGRRAKVIPRNAEETSVDSESTSHTISGEDAYLRVD